MILSHYRAGTGALLIETREEARLTRELLAELPRTAEVAVIAAPSGQLRDARTGGDIKAANGLPGAYGWTGAAPGRVLLVLDWHTLANTPGHWRALIEALPTLRSPKGARETDTASLVCFVGPHWELSPANPLRGALPVLSFALPTRDSLRTTATNLRALPAGTEGEAIVDALCGLSADSAEQAAAEVLARPGNPGWDAAALRESRARLLTDAGLDVWTPRPLDEIGGLSGIKNYIRSHVLPFMRHPKLSVRRILAYGVPGVGKSYIATGIAGELGALVCNLSIPRLKGGIVGQSEGNLRRTLSTLDALGAEAPLVCVIDEIDTIAREGLDGGTSSGMFQMLLTWLEESKRRSQTIVIATGNRLDKLDAALESRFGSARFIFDLPTQTERQAIARIHLADMGAEGDLDAHAKAIGQQTAGYSSREIAQALVPEVLRLSNLRPTPASIKEATAQIVPASQSQTEQLTQMRRAASTLRRANDPEDTPRSTRGRQIASETTDTESN